MSVVQAGARTAAFLSFNVTEQFCDAVRNEEVFRNTSSDQSVPPNFFEVFPRLQGAVLAVPALTVSSTDQRFAGCSPSPSGVPRIVQLGTSTVSLFAVWRATGPATTGQPGVVDRPAAVEAFEFSAGLLNIGDLGPAQLAGLEMRTS